MAYSTLMAELLETYGEFLFVSHDPFQVASQPTTMSVGVDDSGNSGGVPRSLSQSHALHSMDIQLSTQAHVPGSNKPTPRHSDQVTLNDCLGWMLHGCANPWPTEQNKLVCVLG